MSSETYRKILAASSRDTGRVIHKTLDEEGVIEVIDDELLRSLYFGTKSRQSCMLHANPNFLTLLYTQAMMASLLFISVPKSILLIGLGGGSHAKFLLHHFPDCIIDAIESREKVVKVAYGYFMLPETPRLRITIGNAQDMISDIEKNKYDLILIDAFNSLDVNPSITNRNFISECRNRLNDNGVLTINLWSKAEDFKRTFRVINRAFDGNVLRYLVKKRSNIILFAANKTLNTSYLNNLHTKARLMQKQIDVKLTEFLTRIIHQNSLIKRLFN